MKDNLKNLRKIMDDSKFKNLQFKQRNKNAVLQLIENKKKPKREFFQKTFLSVFTFAILAVFMCIILNVNVFDLDNNSSDSVGTIKPYEEKQKQQNVSIYNPKAQNEYNKDMTKKEVVTKMLNTVDYFKTAKGSFTQKVAGHVSEVKYQIILNGKNSAGFSSRTSLDNGTKHTTFFNSDFMWMVNNTEKTFFKAHSSSNENYGKHVTLNEAFNSKTAKGFSTTNNREKPGIGPAISSLFPYELASNYTRDLSNWEIAKQNVELLNHNTIVVKGNLSSFSQSKHKATTFSLWVDKDTGILLKYETYDEEGNVIEYIHPKNLTINGSIDKNNLKPHLKGFSKQQP